MNTSNPKKPSYMETPDFLFKIVIIGNSAVGKSSLLRTFSENHWDQVFTPTIGVDFKIKTFHIGGKSVKLQIWDTAGQERFKSICRSYYKGSHGIIFVYDITDRESFREVENWMEDVDRIAGRGMVKILIGNKCDMEKERQVSYADGNKLAEDLGMKFIETSAKTAYNVVESFKTIATEMKEKVEKNELQTEKSRKGNQLQFNNQSESEEKKKVATCCNVI